MAKGKLYFIIRTEHNGIIGIFTTTKKVWEALIQYQENAEERGRLELYCSKLEGDYDSKYKLATYEKVRDYLKIGYLNYLRLNGEYITVDAYRPNVLY